MASSRPLTAAADLRHSPLTPLGENAAVEPELLPSATLRENQEFEPNAPSGRGSTAALFDEKEYDA